VRISQSHLLALDISAGQNVRIIPLLNPGVKVSGLPSLKNAKDATDIRLREIGQQLAKSKKGDEKEKSEWLSLAARELLGALFCSSRLNFV